MHTVSSAMCREERTLPSEGCFVLSIVHIIYTSFLFSQYDFLVNYQKMNHLVLEKKCLQKNAVPPTPLLMHRYHRVTHRHYLHYCQYIGGRSIFNEIPFLEVMYSSKKEKKPQEEKILSIHQLFKLQRGVR